MKANEAPENYPVQFKDKIDEYLWKEHQILGGCCSSIENLKYSIAREVAEKLTNAFIEKACEWLGPVFEGLAGYYSGAELLDDFKNYMKGE